ncbi:hypothetical protein ACWDVV_34990, partial [Streptomyces tendae]
MTEPTHADGGTRDPLGPPAGPGSAPKRALEAVLGDLRAVDGALYAAVAGMVEVALAAGHLHQAGVPGDRRQHARLHLVGVG